MVSQAFEVGNWLPATPGQVGNAIRIKQINPLTTEWFPIASGGPPGPIGPAGPAGPAGANGTNGAPGPPSFPDAPSDGTSYVRLNGAWTNRLDAGLF